jgi:hypothetical protein
MRCFSLQFILGKEGRKELMRIKGTLLRTLLPPFFIYIVELRLCSETACESQITQRVSDFSLFDSNVKTAHKKHVSNGCASFAEVQKLMDKSLDISWCEQLSTDSVEISSTRFNHLTESPRLKKAQ